MVRVIVSGLVPAHGALGGTAAHVLKAGLDPPRGEVMAHPHIDGGPAALRSSGLAAHNTNGQDHQVTAVVGALLHEVLDV